MKGIPHEVKAALDETGLPWTTEVKGSSLKIRLAGKLVGIISATKDHRVSPARKVAAQIRRAAKEMKP